MIAADTIQKMPPPPARLSAAERRQLARWLAKIDKVDAEAEVKRAAVRTAYADWIRNTAGLSKWGREFGYGLKAADQKVRGLEGKRKRKA